MFDQTSGYGGIPFILLAYVMLVTLWLAAMACQMLAWRRSCGDQREQFKWLAFLASAAPSRLDWAARARSSPAAGHPNRPLME